MGMGNKLFALPWKAFEFASTENKLILNVSKDKLKAAPGFDKDAKWPSPIVERPPRGGVQFERRRR
jgi:hypothetical protein